MFRPPLRILDDFVMIIVLFQETLNSEFPDEITFFTQKNVIIYACCLSDQPELMIKVICDRLVEEAQFCFENNICHKGNYADWSSNSYMHRILRKILNDVPQVFDGKINDQKPEVFVTSESPAEGTSRSPLPYIMFLENEPSKNLILAAQPLNKDHEHVDTYPEHRLWKLMTKTEHLLKKDSVSEWLKSMTYSSIWILIMEGMSLRIRKMPSADGTIHFSDLLLSETNAISEALGIFMELQKRFKSRSRFYLFQFYLVAFRRKGNGISSTD